MVFVPLGAGVRLAKYRQTNIDLIAAQLREQAGPNDLILVYPWYCGITFNRYYHGAAPWTTLPALSDPRIHRYDLLKEKLAARRPDQAGPGPGGTNAGHGQSAVDCRGPAKAGG